MAIDLSQLNIAKDVSDDIKRMVSAPEFYEKVVKEAAQIHIEDARQKTDQGRSVTGGNFQSLSPSYAKRKASVSSESPVANLRYGYDDRAKRRKPKAMDTLRYREGQANREATIYFDGSADSSRRRSSEYMYDHQTGAGSLAQRKFFPEEDDMRSPAQSQNKSKVGKSLQSYLMTPRTINIG